MADFMATAGLAHAGFYRHFKSKDQFVAESFAIAVDSVADNFKTALSKKLSNADWKLSPRTTSRKNTEMTGLAVAPLHRWVVSSFEPMIPRARWPQEAF